MTNFARFCLFLLASVASPADAADVNLRGRNATSLSHHRRLKETKFSESYPLGHCEGDCDSNDDCEGDLVCDDSRKVGEPKPVPGCSISPLEESGTDFCVRQEDLDGGGVTDDSDTTQQLRDYGSNGDKTGALLDMCEGDCDKDSDCSTGHCFQRDGLTLVPGCIGRGQYNYDYCTLEQYRKKTQPSPTTNDLMDYGSYGDKAGALLDKCEGDCDEDSDCSTGHCFQRDGFTLVPGCNGQGRENYDYCTLEQYREKTQTPPATNDLKDYGSNGDKAGALLDMCEGDCDEDNDCSTGYCFQRDGFTPVPGCSGNGKDNYDYCTLEQYRGNFGIGGDGLDYGDTSGGPLVYKGDDPDTSEADRKLGLCEGDCDSDYSCGQGLMCWQRRGDEKNVPGCQNGGSGDIAKKDYCVLEKYRGTDGDQFYNPSSQIFRLKLYWQPGYTWQEESFERKWCIECVYGSCSASERIFLSECSISRNDLLEFIFVDGYVMIKAIADNMCYQRNGNAMSWQICNTDDHEQHFKPRNTDGGSADVNLVEKFELRPRGDNNKCVTQLHHPKWLEWMKLEDCGIPRADQTSLWNKY